MDGETENAPKNEEETVSCKFHWKQQYDSAEVKSVEIILGHSAGVNNDIFEIYTEGVTVKKNSPLMVYNLERDNPSDPTQFSTELHLSKRTYQFIFRTEDVEGRKLFVVSDDYQKTTLVSGRTVNYLEAEKTVTSQEQGIKFVFYICNVGDWYFILSEKGPFKNDITNEVST